MDNIDIINEIKNIKDKEEDDEHMYYVLTYDSENSRCQDVSMFGVREWEDLLEISEQFQNHAMWFTDDDDDSFAAYFNKDPDFKFGNDTMIKQRESAFYLRWSRFCQNCTRWGGFNELESEHIRTDDIYKVISGLVKDSDEKLTVNLFRKWIDENREIIQTHYKNLP
jgi:hypothetical protein